MTRNGKLLIGLIGLVFIWTTLLFWNWGRIETEIAADSRTALDTAGYSRLGVDTERRGRTVNLSGVMRSKGEVDQAVDLVEQVNGVHRVTTSGIEIRPYRPASLSLSKNGEAMTLLGGLASGAAATQLSGQITRALGMPVDYGLSVDPDVESPQWLVGLATAMPAVAPIDDLNVDISDNNLRIAGIIRHEKQYRDALGAFENIPGINSVDTTGLVFKRLEAPWFEMSSSSLSGVVASDQQAELLEQTIGELLNAGSDKQLQVNEEYDTADWINDLSLVMTSAVDVESPVVSYRDGAMRVKGVVRTQAAFDAVAAQAPQLTHTRQLNLSELELRPFAAPWMNVQVSAEQILLQGMVNNNAESEQLVSQVVDATGSGFSGVIKNQLKPDPDTGQAPWANRLGDVIGGVAGIEQGTLDLADNVLTLSGIVRTEEAFEQLQSDAAASGAADTVDATGLALRPFKSPRFALSMLDSRAVASGRVGTMDEASLLGEAVELVFGANDSTQVVVDADVTNATWLNDVMRMMPAVTGLENGGLNATDERIEIAGIARSVESYELVTNVVASLSSDTIQNSVALRPWQQPSLQIKNTESGLKASGLMPDEQTVQNIIGQLGALSQSSGQSADSAVDVGTDIQNTRWLAPLVTAIPAMAEVNQAELLVADGKLLLTGQTSDQQAADRLLAEMAVVAPDLEIDNQIVVVLPLVMESGAGSAGVPQVSADAQPLQDGQTAIAYPNIAQQAIERCERSLDAAMVDSNIEFASASAFLSASSTPVLIRLIRAIRDCPEVLIEVSGHTDSTGSEDRNLELSNNRAQTVVDYLLTAGISTSRLQAQGYGSSVPIADNATPDGRALNRRIEFNIKTKR